MAKKKPVSAPLNALNMALLAAVAVATLPTTDAPMGSFVYVSQADAAPFVNHVPPLFMVNPALVDAEGRNATRATDDGLAMYKASLEAAKTPAPAGDAGTPTATDKPTFKFATVDVPEVKRGGGQAAGVSIYPFDDLGVKGNTEGKPNSFFVPATTERPEPAKALASTVSSATRRWSEPDKAKPTKDILRVKKDAAGNTVLDAAGKKVRETVSVPNLIAERQFVIRAVEDGAAWGFPGVKGAAIIRTT